METIYQFLACETPKAWVDYALEHLDQLLIDHAHCEKKAASSALSFLYHQMDKPELMQRMSKLAREELRHFEQVLKILAERGIAYTPIEASHYAAGMHVLTRKEDPERLVDRLIIGAFIEARSCERFAAIAPHLDPQLQKFYNGLLASEARHFQHYLEFAKRYANKNIDERIQLFRNKEASLIMSPDHVFCFHSGIPQVMLN